MERGLLLIFTGNTEDNAISAVGQVLRALGRGLNTCVVQFDGGSQQYRQLAYLQQFFDRLETHGIDGDSTTGTRVEPADLWRQTVAILNSGEWDMLVLLGLSYLTDHNLLQEKELLDVVRNRPASLHVVVAGGRSLDSLVHEADLVTEVGEIKNEKVSAEVLNAS